MFLYCHSPRAAAAGERAQVRREQTLFDYDGEIATASGRFLYKRDPERCAYLHVSEGPDAGDFAYLFGMLFYSGKTGDAALKQVFEDFSDPGALLPHTKGQFTLAIYKDAKLHLLTDSLGINKIYHDEGLGIFSNFFMPVADSVQTPLIDTLGCYEYAWNGVAGGTKTFFRQVRTVPAGQAVVAGPQVAFKSMPMPDLGESDTQALSQSELLDRHLERLRSLTDLLVGHFGDRLHVSMSGGYDSRLLLGLLLDAGVKPRVFAYGPPGDPECGLVEAIAKGEGLSFEQVDKSRPPTISPDAYPAHLEQNLKDFDGWKIDGLFDEGADAPDRRARARDGRIKVNGSAGEIYRNFFYLPDGAYRARDLVWSFYSQYAPATGTAAFDRQAYEETLAREIRQAVGASGERLQRRDVELAYPLFRVRYWTAREIPINQAFGPCLFPFLEPDLIKGTCDISIGLKSHGFFEGRLIRRLNARLAGYSSNYGYSFAKDPPYGARLRALLTYCRPTYLRRFTYRLKHLRSEERPYFLGEDYLRQVIDPRFPLMREFFNIDRINDADVLNRVATMEYLCQRAKANTAE